MFKIDVRQNYWLKNNSESFSWGQFYKIFDLIINGINKPTIGAGFINRETIKRNIPKQIQDGFTICQTKYISITPINGIS